MRGPARFLIVAIAFLALAVGVSAQTQPPAPAPHVVIVTARPISSSDGGDIFMAYCASCHGRDAKGTGAAARVLETPPPDLTLIAVTHNNVDCRAHVVQALRYGHERDVVRLTANHVDMPDWWPVLRSLPGGDTVGELRIYSLAKYVESIQAKK